jgi:hypothetical protein
VLCSSFAPYNTLGFMKTERVLTVNDYYDGPRLGVAELDGVPHFYEAEFDHSADEYGDTFFLSPVPADLLALVLEDWAIWLRWERAFRAGEVDQDTHPALPADRERHAELKRLVGNRLRVDPDGRIKRKARFNHPAGSPRWEGFVVEWSPA